jgi:hypothetical protein
LGAFVRRNVAVNSPTTPRNVKAFPMTASMYDLTGTNAVGDPLVPELMIALGPTRVQKTAATPDEPGGIAMWVHQTVR